MPFSYLLLSFRERERERERVNRSYSLLSRILASVLSLVLLFLLSVPSSFAQMLGSSTYYSSRFYPLTLLSQGDPLAGMHGTEENILSMPTTRWSNLAINMNTGNVMVIVQPINLPGTPALGWKFGNNPGSPESPESKCWAKVWCKKWGCSEPVGARAI